MKNLNRILICKSKAVRVIYISSYIPRKCGIATYTKDLTNAINLLNPYALAEIMAVSRNGEKLEYPWEVKFKIEQNNLNSYLQAAEYINQSGANLISLQHEFGLFGGHRGEYIIPLIESIKHPLVTTLHTVASDPDSEEGVIIKRLIKRSKAVVVMMERIKKKLVNQYGAPSDKIVSILHGTPDLPHTQNLKFKEQKGLSGKLVLGNINLLSPSKGIEYALRAVSLIAKKYPNVLYLIVGQTHPVLLHESDEAYRNYLKKTIRTLKIEKNVKFINKYLPLDQLIGWLKTFDFYVTPYIDPHQAASGALAYAVGAGKCCISTPYIYAKEVLSKGRGALVPFHNPQAIASSVINLIEQPYIKKRIENKAYEYGRLMTWANVALRHFDLFRTITNEESSEKKCK